MGVKIVVAEDDRSTLAYLEKTLILQGFWVYGTRDGAEAFEVIKEEMPDLVISDMLMPKLHGLDLCTKIKESPELQHIKVIMITGVYPGSLGQREALSHGADSFIVKPIDPDHLVDRIFELLNINANKFRKEFVKQNSEEKE
ncbi:PleD family two-component system response regulator [Acidobacteriota bacterium]